MKQFGIRTWRCWYANEFYLLSLRDDELGHWDNHPHAKSFRLARLVRNRRASMKANYWRDHEKSKAMARAKMSRNRVDKTNYHISKILRNRVGAVLRGINKSAPTLNLIGCDSIDHLRAWIQLHFKPGMSWRNHGEWHIDHIVPCAAFNLADPEQQKACFNYKNLQPLWALENLQKSDKL